MIFLAFHNYHRITARFLLFKLSSYYISVIQNQIFHNMALFGYFPPWPNWIFFTSAVGTAGDAEDVTVSPQSFFG